MRPTDTGPAHARHDRAAFRPSDTTAVWPAHRSEVLTRRPGWPVEDPPGPPSVPFARTAGSGPRHAAPVVWPSEQDLARIPPQPKAAEPVRKKPEPPKRKTVSADMYFDTVPMGTIPRRAAVAHVLPETGLATFDLGNVPASVTPPRSWRRAAWFAVGTSAAVVFGLAVASAELMGRPVNKEPMIDALPAFPTGPMTLEQLPNEQTTSEPASTTSPSHPGGRTTSPPARPSGRPHDTVIGNTTHDTTHGTAPGTSTTTGGTGTSTPTATSAPTRPPRHTVGPQPVTPTDPAQMGDVTEAYLRAVVDDPAAAYAMTTGSMAREGQEGIEQRYAGVRRIEVQEITIDRNQAVTTSRVTVVREDGSAVVERRRLTFTWGGDPKITADTTT